MKILEINNWLLDDEFYDMETNLYNSIKIDFYNDDDLKILDDIEMALKNKIDYNE